MTPEIDCFPFLKYFIHLVSEIRKFIKKNEFQKLLIQIVVLAYCCKNHIYILKIDKYCNCWNILVEVKKEIQELYGLINYGVLRKKIKGGEYRETIYDWNLLRLSCFLI